MRRSVILALFALSTPAAPAAFAAQAALSSDEGRFQAAFEVNVGGFRVMDIESDSAIDDERYRQAVTVETAGMLAWFVEGRSETVSVGRIGQNGAVEAERFLNEGLWNDERRAASVQFDEAGRIVAYDVEPFEPDEREQVPEELQRGPDPLSLIVEAALAPKAGEAVERTVQSFDGKRAMRFTLSCPATTEALTGAGGDIYSGPTLRCAIAGEQIAGFHRKYSKNNLNPPEPAKLWLAPVDGGAFYAPVKLMMDTRFGGLVATLTRIGPPPPQSAER